MGCFNTTCFLSNSPIMPGNKVKLFVLVSNENSYRSYPEEPKLGNGAKCYAWDDYSLLSCMHMDAIYDDYGNYDIEENFISEMILSLISNNYCMNEKIQGRDYNDHHDCLNIHPASLDWVRVQDMIHEGRLFFNQIGSRKPFVSMIAIHEDIFNTFFGHVDKKDQDSFFSDNIEKIKNMKREDEIMDELLKCDKENVERTTQLMQEFSNIRKITSQYDRRYDYPFIFGSEDPFSHVYNFIDESEELLYECNETDISLNILKTITFAKTCSYEFNKKFEPMMLSGQQYDFDTCIDYHQKMLDALLKLKKESDEED